MTNSVNRLPACLVALACLLGGLVAQAEVTPHPGMLRFPDISATHIAFVYANDIWTVPREGGVASPLASPPGAETFPRFSPDGRTLAFVGNYDGTRSLYTIPVEGGIPFRVTHHPAGAALRDWTSEGKLLFFRGGTAGLQRQTQIFTVSPKGGLPEKLPVPYGANPAISGDGQWLAYTLHTRDGATWKRYRGGMATDIWLFNLRDLTSKKITDWEGTDSLPMWHGQTVYYLSDAGSPFRLNLWAYDTKAGQRRQLTKFTDWDVKFPSIGPGPGGGGEIVFQHGSELMVLDLPSGKTRTVTVSIPGDRPRLRPQTVDAAGNIVSFSASATGKRAAFEARGDLWTVPAENGTPRNLTRTAGAAERQASWSPDGRWIAYFSDQTGEYELFVVQADGKEPARQLTKGNTTFFLNPQWSPDSKQILFSDKNATFYLVSAEGGEVKTIDKDPLGFVRPASWSHDSGWIAFSRSESVISRTIWLYEVATGKKTKVLGQMFPAGQPAFDREGKYLFYTSSMGFSGPQYEDLGSTFVYSGVQRLMMVPLRNDVASPFLPKSDEESWDKKDGDKKEGDKKDGDKKEGDKKEGDKKEGDKKEGEKKDEKPKEPLKIDLDGFEGRAIVIPVAKGRFFGLTVAEKGVLVYVRVPVAPVAGDDDGDGGGGSIQIFDPAAETAERKEKTVLAGVANFDITADGKKLLVSKDNRYAFIDIKPEQKFEKPLDLGGLKAEVDPRAEWRQMFHDAWKRFRDYFYVENMHGVDWKAVGAQYEKMLDDCADREDLAYVISEMMSELNVGHAYYLGGTGEDEPNVGVGMLGADFELKDGAYRIARILKGGPWDADARSPLAQPGIKAAEGDFLLAVNGVPMDTAQDPWAAFIGLAGKTVTLTLSAKPQIDKEARDVVLTLLGNEGDLRYRAWVEANRRLVDEKSGGRVGYIHVPDTGINGQNELLRQFYGQVGKDALIIDERWNGGGQIPTRFVELLNRPLTNYWARRDGADWPWPFDSHHGPKCMLINGLAGSGGDAFPYYFRQAKVGKLIGTRTWGGLVGITGVPPLIDGVGVAVPRFGFYKLDGTWGIEGHGVDPDIEVVDDPALMTKGGDPQLDAAITLMQDELKAKPPAPPRRPADPDRRGMGIPEKDR